MKIFYEKKIQKLITTEYSSVNLEQWNDFTPLRLVWVLMHFYFIIPVMDFMIKLK